jgi:hypothetical protein
VASLVVGICGADQDPAIAAGKKNQYEIAALLFRFLKCFFFI